MRIQQIKTVNFNGWLTLMNNNGNTCIVDSNKITSLESHTVDTKQHVYAKVQGDNSKYLFPSFYSCDDAIVLIGQSRLKPYNHCYDLDFDEDKKSSYFNFFT